jgi:glycosyltransferase involved in cell wall biosynthesis
VIDGETGALVPVPDAHAFADAIRGVVDGRLDRAVIRRNAERFSVDAFKRSFETAVHETMVSAAP